MEASAKRRTSFEREFARNLRCAALERVDTISFQFRMLWQLPATDPRFLDTPFTEMALDIVAADFHRNPKKRDEVVTEDYDEELAEMEKLADSGEVADAFPVWSDVRDSDEWEEA